MRIRSLDEYTAHLYEFSRPKLPGSHLDAWPWTTGLRRFAGLSAIHFFDIELVIKQASPLVQEVLCCFASIHEQSTHTDSR